MLDKFIDCLAGDMSGLIIEGTPSAEQLEEAFSKVYTHFAELSSDGTYNEVFELSKRIEELKGMIYLADGIINHLQLSYDQRLVDILNAYALRCDLEENDIGDVMVAKLNRVVGRAKKWVLRLKQLQKDLNKIRSNNTGKMNDNYWSDQLDNISKYLKTYISSNMITVARFCRTLNKMNTEYEKAEYEKRFKKK